MSNTLWPHGLYSPWNSPGQNTGVGNLFLLQGICPTQGSNPGLLHCRRILFHLSHKGNPFNKHLTNLEMTAEPWHFCTVPQLGSVVSCRACRKSENSTKIRALKLWLLREKNSVRREERQEDIYTRLGKCFPGGSDGKEPACNAGDLGSVPGLGRSPGEGNGNSLQYSCLENPMDRGTWWVTVHGVTKSQTWLSN